ncbi:MAG: protein kinase domain-containing protein, partial [Acidobacteriota bacterium]
IGDFGLAGLYADAHGATVPSASALATTAAVSPPLTQAGDVFGTPAYMAPELAGGVHDIQPSSDVFAFGLIAYELLAGKPAFAVPPLVARMEGRAIAEPALDGVDPIVARCLALDPAARPTAAEAAEALA